MQYRVVHAETGGYYCDILAESQDKAVSILADILRTGEYRLEIESPNAMEDTQTPYTPTPWEVDYAEVSGSNARLITASVNSYAKHCGPNAIQCAEDDLLGEALDLLQARRDLLDAERVLTHNEEDEYDALQRCLSRLPKQIT